MGKIATDATLQEMLTLLLTFLNTQQSGLEAKIGSLPSLSTLAKDTIVAAINELVTKNGTQDNAIGLLSSLTTSAKASLVAAINELAGANAATRLTALETSTSELDQRVAMLKGNTYADNLSNKGNAGRHNSIFGGRNLGEALTATQLANIANGSFKDLWVGDRLAIPGTYGFYIAGFNFFTHYLWPSDNTAASYDLTARTNHVVFVGLASLSGGAPYKADGDISGGYMGSDIRAAINNKSSDFYQRIITAIGGEDHLLKHVDWLPNAANANGEFTGFQQVNDSCIEVCSWRHLHHSITGFPGGNNTYKKIQSHILSRDNIFPIFNFINPYLLSPGIFHPVRELKNALEVYTAWIYHVGYIGVTATNTMPFVYFTVKG